MVSTSLRGDNEVILILSNLWCLKYGESVQLEKSFNFTITWPASVLAFCEGTAKCPKPETLI